MQFGVKRPVTPTDTDAATPEHWSRPGADNYEQRSLRRLFVPIAFTALAMFVGLPAPGEHAIKLLRLPYSPAVWGAVAWIVLVATWFASGIALRVMNRPVPCVVWAMRAVTSGATTVFACTPWIGLATKSVKGGVLISFGFPSILVTANLAAAISWWLPLCVSRPFMAKAEEAPSGETPLTHGH